MTTVDRHIRTLLQSASQEREAKGVQEAYGILLQNIHPGNAVSGEAHLSIDLFVSCAEAAILCGAIELASQCLTSFFASSPPTNQYLCRAYYCRAQIEGTNVDMLKGPDAAQQCLVSLNFVMQGLSLIQSDPKYQFLVYNGSVVYWQLCRPLMQDRLKVKLIPTLSQIVKALEDSNDSDYEWRVRYLLNLARCYEEAKQIEDAVRVSQTAFGLCQKQAPSMKREAYRVLIHVSRHKPDVLGKAKSDAGNNADLKALALLQCVKSGVTVQQPLIEKDLQEAVKLIEKTDEEILAEIGLTALFKGIPSLAENCAKSGLNSKSLRARVFSELIFSEMMIRNLGDQESQLKFTNTMVNTRIDALKRLEKALASSARTGDETLIEDTCLLIWNAALPLLQTNLRANVKRPLEKAAAALEEIRSQFHRIRVQIHLELSKCEIDDDLLVKARQEVEKGLSLDYPISDEEFESLRVLRPLDRFLEPLKARLDLRTRLYVQPERPEEQAMLLIDQARDAKENSLKATLLERAVIILQAPTQSDPSLGGRDDKTILKERTYLWIDIIKTAWKHKMLRLVRKCIPYALASEWDVVRDKDLVRLQADVQFINGETMIMEGEDSGDDMLIIKAATCFLEGIRLGLKLMEDFMVVNGCIYMWNYFVPFFKVNRNWEIVGPLEEVYGVLTKMENRPIQLFCNISNAFVCALEQLAVQRANGAIPPAEEPGKKGDAAGSKVKSNPVANLSTSPDLKKAEEACRAALLIGTPMQKKDLLSSFSRICRLRGVPAQLGSTAKGAAPVEAESQIIIYLEQLTNSPEPSSKKKEYLLKTSELLREASNNVELHARAGKEAFKLQEYVLASEFAKTALMSSPKDIDSAVIRQSEAKAWRWFSLCEELLGKCLLASIDPTRQEKGFQDQLRQQAINHFATAVKFASKANVQVLILSVSRNFWNAATAFMMSPVTRRLLLKPLQIIVENLPPTTSEDSESLEFRVSLYKLLFECYSDQGMWKEGVNLVGRAFESLPQEHHKALWEAKISFLTKVGKDVAGEMFKIKEYNPQTQARVWVTVARSSSNKYDQLVAYQKAIHLLESYPVSKVDFIIEFGEWLYCNNFPIQDAQDQLQAAADVLLDAEMASSSAIDERFETNSDISQSISMSQKSMGTSKSRNLRTSRNSIGRQSIPSSRGDTPSLSSKSGPRSRAMSRGTVSSQLNEEMQMEEMTIHHYEMLCRIYLMLARMSPNFSQRIDNCFLGYTYFMKMWEMSVENANIAEQEETVPDKGATSKVETFSYPDDLSGWVEYSINPKLRQRFKEKSSFMINKKTIAKPELLYWYVNYMIDCLKQFGYHLHCCPILIIFELIAEDVMGSKGLSNLIRLEFGHLIEQLNLPTLSHSVIDALGSFELSEGTKRLYMEEIRQRKQIKASLDSQSQPASSLDTKGKSKTTNQVKVAPPVKKVSYYRILHPIYVHEIWLRQAAVLYEQGYIKLASELLHEVKTHADTYDDEMSYAECLHLQAKIAYLQGEFDSSFELEEMVLRSPQEIDLFIRSTISLVTYMSQCNQLSQAKTQLQERIELLVQLQDSQSNCMNDIQIAVCRLKLCYGALLLKEAHITKVNGTPYANEVKESVKTFTDSLQELSSHTTGPLYVESVLNVVDSLMSPICTDVHPKPFLTRLIRENLRRAVVEGTKCYQNIIAEPLKGNLSLPLSRLLNKAKILIADAELYLAPSEIRSSYVPIMDETFGDLRALIPSPRIDESKAIHHLAEERAFVLATTAFNQATVPSMHAEAYNMLGKCLKLVSLKKLKAVAGQNTETPNEISRVGTGLEKTDLVRTTDTREGLDQSTTRSLATMGTVPNSTPMEEINYSAQMQEVLKSAISIALKEDLMNVAIDACFQLFESFLDTEPHSAAEYLVLGQSCMVRKELLATYRSACDSANREELFRKLMDHLRKTIPQPSEHPVFKKCQAYMQSHSLSSKYLDVRSSFSDIISAIPQATRYLILQSSPSTPEGIPVNVALVGSDPASTKTFKKLVKRHEFETLNAAIANFKYSMQTMSGRRRRLKKREESPPKMTQAHSISSTNIGGAKQRPSSPATEASGRSKQSTQKKAASGKGLSNSKSSQLKAQAAVPLSIQEESDFIEVDDGPDDAEATNQSELKQFEEILRMSEAYVQLLCSDIKEILLAESNPAFNLVIIADSSIQQIPMESVSLFKKCLSVTRDFSLHIHHRRLSTLTEKKQPMLISKNSFGYIIDPRNEDALSHRKKPASGLPAPTMPDGFTTEILRANPFTKDWKGITGLEYLPSPGEWQHLLRAYSQFIYYGFGRPMAFFDPKYLVGLNLDDSNFALLLGLVLNDTHYFQQMKLDNLKTDQQRTLESTINTAALFTLQGCKSIVLNQWGTSVEANHSLLSVLFRGLKANKSTAESLHQLFRLADSAPDIHESVQLQHRFNPVIYGLPGFKMDQK